MTLVVDELVSNRQPRCPAVVLLDTSSSVSPVQLTELRAALQLFVSDLRDDPVAALRVDLAVITSGGSANLAQDFVTAKAFEPPRLEASGHSKLDDAVHMALDLIADRKSAYSRVGVRYFRPLLWIMSASDPEGPEWQNAARRARAADRDKRVSVFTVGVGPSVDLARLALLSTRPPVRLEDYAFNQMFTWLSVSLQARSKSAPIAGSASEVGTKVDGEKIKFDPIDWGTQDDDGFSQSFDGQKDRQVKFEPVDWGAEEEQEASKFQELSIEEYAFQMVVASKQPGLLGAYMDVRRSGTINGDRDSSIIFWLLRQELISPRAAQERVGPLDSCIPHLMRTLCDEQTHLGHAQEAFDNLRVLLSSGLAKAETIRQADLIGNPFVERLIHSISSGGTTALDESFAEEVLAWMMEEKVLDPSLVLRKIQETESGPEAVERVGNYTKEAFSLFICYRHEDSKSYVDRLHDRLTQHFDRDQVFVDSSIPVGENYKTFLKRKIRECSALLVVIGGKWLGVSGRSGKRRLHEPDDHVRREIEIGLERRIPIIPVHLTGVTRIDPDELPASIRDLAYIKAMTLDPGPHFDVFFPQLIEHLERLRDPRG